MFFPERFGFDVDADLSTLSARTLRQTAGEVGRLEAAGVDFRRDCPADLDALFGMNLQSFGDASYFRDPRFQASFEDLAETLSASGMLRLTAVLVGGASPPSTSEGSTGTAIRFWRAEPPRNSRASRSS